MTFSGCKFTYNHALKQGGALYTECKQNNCIYFIDSSTLFMDNSAGLSGGAIQWLDVAPSIPLSISASSQ